MAAPTVPFTSASLQVSGARLYHEVRGEGPVVALVGAPMAATSFAPLADLLAESYLVLTADPRGIGRSPVDDPDQDCSPEMRAEDLSRLLVHLGAGPAAVLGSSGGAVSALALVESHPEQVHTVIAHEPPLHELVEDRELLRAQTEEIIATYLSGDTRGAWVKFFATANFDVPEDVLEEMLGAQRDPQATADDHYQFVHMMRATTRWQPDFAALRAAPTRILIGIGEDSGGQLCDRTSRALATALEVEPTLFPGGHIGFVEDPDAFASRLRAVLDGS